MKKVRNGFFVLAVLIIGTSVLAESELPQLNRKIVDFLDEVMGTQVDRGECWDLASVALQKSGAYFDRSSLKTIYQFGRIVDPKKEIILPGDIVQFEKVELKYQVDDAVYTESMAHHTAIVYEVTSPGNFVLAHQNTSFSGRKVGKSPFILSQMTKGKVTFYRPVSDKYSK
ncbi:MAG: hypothetical protein JJU28_21060 [Cyclobacteriaceae bacterium]|nr:hypothetical protein [Cyclobacteriaceae bacterium]